MTTKIMKKDKNDELVTRRILREELRGFATNDKLKAFATKEDLKAFATKEDLKACATKEALAEIKAQMYTKQDHAKFVESLLKIMVTKQDLQRETDKWERQRAKDLEWMDKSMTEIEASRQERILFEQKLLRMDDRIYDHEKRITTLEKQKV